MYDQGLVGPGLSRMGPTYRHLRPARSQTTHGKFTVHTPQLSGGIRRATAKAGYIGVYMALKRMIVRSAPRRTSSARSGPGSSATLVAGRRAISDPGRGLDKKTSRRSTRPTTKALGLGSLNAATLPDRAAGSRSSGAASSSTAPSSSSPFSTRRCRSQCSARSFTTEHGKFGSKGTSDVGKQGSTEIARYDGACLADLPRLSATWCAPSSALNYPGQ